MRRVDRQLTPEMAIELLKKNDYGVLSLVLESGEPYGVPINYGLSLDCKSIIMHAALTGLKLEAIAHQPKGSFCVVHAHEVNKSELTTHYASVIVSGKLKLVDTIEHKRALLVEFLRHYGITEAEAKKDLDQATKRTALIVMSIDSLSAKGHPDAEM
jgi:nitroimidazol reductase NimA-like FMN-containing flavoprotein (pyridoxamine 5'-phosphate oxidase superfamily)